MTAEATYWLRPVMCRLEGPEVKQSTETAVSTLWFIVFCSFMQLGPKKMFFRSEKNSNFYPACVSKVLFLLIFIACVDELLCDTIFYCIHYGQSAY